MSEPHVCDCGDCSPVPYEDRCRFEKERDQARADVLKLRSVMQEAAQDADWRLINRALADTGYEQYR